MRNKQPSPINGLSATQRDAIRLLASGCTAKYTALVLKLDYAHVRRWIKQDAQFQTELESQYAQQRAQASVSKGESEKKKMRMNKDVLAGPEVRKNRRGLASG